MTAIDLLKVLLELDQQCLTSRPSPWGLAAELVRDVCEAAVGRGPCVNPSRIGDVRSVDLSAVRKPAPPSLSQPTLDAIQALEPEPVRLRPDALGQLIGDFRDLTGTPCDIQESTRDGDEILWLGGDDVMRLNRTMVAALLPHLERFVRTGGLKGADSP